MHLSLLISGKHFIEKSAYGFFTALGDLMKVSSGSTRLFFIYASFITVASPLFFLLPFGFVQDMAKHFRRRRSIVWDL